jgi:hypothetical protein
MNFHAVGNSRILRGCVISICLWLCGSVAANHGPGTSGGGSGTTSGETLREGTFDLSFRLDFTEFEHIGRAEAERRAIDAGEFDSLRRSVVNSLSLSYGLTDDFQISGQIGYYAGSDFIDAEASGPSDAESATADPHGITDLWLTAKYRFIHNQIGSIAAIAAVKAPVGRDGVHLSNGEPLEPSSQPGTGTFDFQFGLAYSRFLTSQVTVDASSLYTLRTEHDGFRVGDRFDAGVALAYRLTEDINHFPNFSVFGEALVVWLGNDLDEGKTNPNSGGTTVYLSPGFRTRFSNRLSATIAPAFPVVQDLNGDQIKSQFKLALTLSFSF